MDDNQTDIEAQIAALRRQISELQGQHSVIDMGTHNDQVGASITVQGDLAGRDIVRIYLGREPHEDEQRALGGYLHSLQSRLRPLLLRGLAERLDERGRRPDLSLVYTVLATQSFEEVAYGSLIQLAPYFTDSESQQLQPVYDPDHALPQQAVVRINVIAPKGGERVPRRRLLRSRLASEAVAREQVLVLLGDPGSGKTTFLRHLAWALALRGLGETPALLGWDRPDRRVRRRDRDRPTYVLPVIISLRQLARRLVAAPDPAAIVRAVALVQLTEGGRAPDLMDSLLGASFDTGAALLLCDGLDEVPTVPQPESATRIEVLQALRDFTTLYPNARLLVTCRTRAFDETLAEAVDWPVERLAPFTRGQIRHLITALYDELVACEVIPATQQERLRTELLAAIEGSTRLMDMARTPLLLTLMALVLVNQGALPHDRPLLYERVLDLLLGRWDRVRDGETLAEAIGQPDWDADRLAPLLNTLSYQAHRDAGAAGERGGIARSALRDALISFFEQAKVPTPMAAAERCLIYFEQRSGLLIPDETYSYTFAHLTLQEHCAGRYLIGLQKPVDALMSHRHEDRWREPIFLGLGLNQRTTPFVIVEVLRRLLTRSENHKPKDSVRWQRDLILAAELAEDRRWERLAEAGADIEPLQDELRNGMVELLDDQSGRLPLEERIRAGYALGHLGDPRPDPRREEYWCKIPAGYVEVDGEQVWVDEFEIAKYPVTWGEWTRFARETTNPVMPNVHPKVRTNFGAIVMKITYAHEYCDWLTKQKIILLRLPTQAELLKARDGAIPDIDYLPIGCTKASKYGLTSIDFFEASIPYLSEDPFAIRLARDIAKKDAADR